MSTLERAIEIATAAHRGQLDKAGNDYITHPLRVMAAGKTADEKIVGVLHDVVEDTEWTFEMLAAEHPEPLETSDSLYADAFETLVIFHHVPFEP